MLNQGQCVLCGLPADVGELCQTSFAQIVRCNACGIVRTWPPRSAEELAALHTSDTYFQHRYFETRRQVGREALRRRYRRIIALLSDGYRGNGRRLLDVGCDTGALLVVARDDFGLAVTGVDVSPRAAEVARRVHGVDVLVGDVNGLDVPDGTFDFITLADVVEHAADPIALMGAARRLLRTGGRLYVATSDHDALINRVALLLYGVAGPRSWPILERLYIPYHEFYFTRATLARAVTQAGLEIRCHRSREFPLDEFRHGLLLKLGLMAVFPLQWVFGRQTLQELVATKVA